MSYLFVIIIGAIAGWVAGQYVKGSELGLAPDLIAGAAGAALAVLITRIIGIEAATGFLMSLVVSVIGGLVGLFSMRHATKEAPVPVKSRRRR